MKTLFVFNEVLCDENEGMAVIIADDLDECRELFMNEMVNREFNLEEQMFYFDRSVKEGEYQGVCVNGDETSRIVSYVCG